MWLGNRFPTLGKPVSQISNGSRNRPAQPLSPGRPMKFIQTLAQWTRPAALLAAIALTHSVSHAQNVADIVKRGKVTIGVVSGAPPFGTTDANGNPAGYDVDVANLVAKYMAVPVEIVPLTSPSRIPALESGKVDFLVATL